MEMRKKALVLLALVSAGAGAQVRLNMTRTAEEDAIIAGKTSLLLHVEQLRCVTSYRMETKGDTTSIVVQALGPSEMAVSDSEGVKIYPTRGVDGKFGYFACGDTMPSLHTHIPRNGNLYGPSPRDSVSLANSKARFALLLLAKSDSEMTIMLYGFKPNPEKK